MLMDAEYFRYTQVGRLQDMTVIGHDQKLIFDPEKYLDKTRKWKPLYCKCLFTFCALLWFILFALNFQSENVRFVTHDRFDNSKNVPKWKGIYVSIDQKLSKLTEKFNPTQLALNLALKFCKKLNLMKLRTQFSQVHSNQLFDYL